MDNIEEFKQALISGMIANYKNDKALAPIVFFADEDKMSVSMIPPDLMSSPEGQNAITETLKRICENPDIVFAGVLFEAVAYSYTDPDDPVAKLIKERVLAVAQMPDKMDIIVLIYATPLEEGMITHLVDPAEGEVLKRINGQHINVNKSFTGFFDRRHRP